MKGFVPGESGSRKELELIALLTTITELKPRAEQNSDHRQYVINFLKEKSTFLIFLHIAIF